MIRYRDFSPALDLTEEGFKLESLETAVSAANAWLTTAAAKVVNVETVTLPNIYAGGEAGTQDTALRTPAQDETTWYQFVRVWYEE